MSIPVALILIGVAAILTFFLGMNMGRKSKLNNLSPDEIRNLGDKIDEKVNSLQSENEKLAQRWETVGNLTSSLGQMKDRELLSHSMSRLLKEEFHAPYTAILLREENVYRAITSEGLHADSEAMLQFPVNDPLISYLKRFPGVVTLEKTDREYRAFKEMKEQFEQVVIMPLQVQENMRGLLWLALRPGSSHFTEGEKYLLSYLGQSMAYILYNIENMAQLERRALSIITGLAKASEQRDEFSNGHSERVSAYATMFARHIGMSHQEVEIIRRAGLMHDIGKIGISEAILNKPGKLTSEEFEKVKAHPVLAVDFLKILGFLKHEQVLILHHHEKFDGTGYPYGLAGAQIPRGAAILSLCDVFDALTHKTSYRDAFAIDEALKVMESMREKNFEAAGLDQFLNFVRDRLRATGS